MAQSESVLTFLTSVQGNDSLKGGKERTLQAGETAPRGVSALGEQVPISVLTLTETPRPPGQTSQAPPRSPSDRRASPLGSVLGPFSPILGRNPLGRFQENPPPLISDQIPHAHPSRQSNANPLT